MTKILDEVLAANTKYAENFGDKSNLPLPPSRHFAILTCMDARLDPARQPIVSNGCRCRKVSASLSSLAQREVQRASLGLR
jgi:hypothetical protein